MFGIAADRGKQPAMNHATSTQGDLGDQAAFVLFVADTQSVACATVIPVWSREISA